MREDELRIRVLEEARYFVETQSTVRETAKAFGVSKSTIHNHLTRQLPTYNPSLAGKAQALLKENMNERAFRGGIATKIKYLMKKQ